APNVDNEPEPQTNRLTRYPGPLPIEGRGRTRGHRKSMMSWKSTWSLVGAAVALFVFIVVFERRLSPSDAPAPLPMTIVPLKPAGDQAYVQLGNSPGIYVVPAEIMNRLPAAANDWRETALINLEGLNVDRVEVRNQGRIFTVQVNPTNGQFYLTRPGPARADR